MPSIKGDQVAAGPDPEDVAAGPDPEDLAFGPDPQDVAVGPDPEEAIDGQAALTIRVSYKNADFLNSIVVARLTVIAGCTLYSIFLSLAPPINVYNIKLNFFKHRE